VSNIGISESILGSAELFGNLRDSKVFTSEKRTELKFGRSSASW
jgi:hypothetical protein